MGNSTDVYRVDAAGQLTLERRDVGFDVVGAGVSTCAPVGAPASKKLDGPTALLPPQ